ncbi:MAG: hypothetical protein AAF558_06040 [Verrucomicrobiota bacterium]
MMTVQLVFRIQRLLVTASAFLLLVFSLSAKSIVGSSVHYVEFVSKDVAKQCALLEEIHGVPFGSEVKDLGQAKVAKTKSGVLLGVRAPMALHEKPIIRVYFAVDDIAKAIKTAEAAGAMVAYPPTKQGETGTWAIYILGGIQHGLWQK